jgi:glycosyltransferase involved in cell wall biosynthesis
MRITWSLPVRGERLDSSRGDLVRARSLTEALRADRHDVRVVEDAARSGSAVAVYGYRNVARKILPGRAALILRDIGRVMHARAHGRRVAAVARQQEANVIIETQVHFANSGALAAHLTGLPLILDDCSPVSEEIALGAGLPQLARRVFNEQVKSASAIIVPSQAMREQFLCEGIPAERLHVVPNGVDLEAFQNVDRDAVRRGLGVAEECLIGYAGSFQPWHRVDLLVEALARLLARKLPVHLLLIGDGQERQAVLALGRRLGLDGRVTSPGAVAHANVPELIASCDIGVLPGSNDYGHPMKLVEYAAARVPSIAPNLAPVREVLEDGVTGLLVLPNNLDALTASLARLVTDEALRRRLGESTRQRIMDHTSWRNRARALVSCASQQQTSVAALEVSRCHQ